MDNSKEFIEISEVILETYIKPLSDEGDYSDATGIVGMVLRSNLTQNLLHNFWQRTSDACPLEATEAENQEKEFAEYVAKL